MVFQNYALFPHLSVRAQRRLRPADARRGRAETARRVDEALRLVQLRPRATGCPASSPGPAAAGRHRPGHRDRTAAGADGRAAVQPRRHAAAGHAHRDPRCTSQLGLDHGLRDPRPGGGAVAGRPPGRAARGAVQPGRYARGALRLAGQLDVADFMGYRNRFVGRLVGREGDRAIVEAEGVRLAGVLRAPLADGAAAV